VENVIRFAVLLHEAGCDVAPDAARVATVAVDLWVPRRGGPYRGGHWTEGHVQAVGLHGEPASTFYIYESYVGHVLLEGAVLDAAAPAIAAFPPWRLTLLAGGEVLAVSAETSVAAVEDGGG
jgi:hypothetical protein